MDNSVTKPLPTDIANWLASLRGRRSVPPMTTALAPLTADHYAAILALVHVTPRDSARDTGVSDILAVAQRGTCADCGEVAPLEFAHIANSYDESGKAKAGRMTSDGVVLGAMCCRACNLTHVAVLDVLGLPRTAPLPFEYAQRLYVMTPGELTRADAVKAYRARATMDYAAEARARLGM